MITIVSPRQGGRHVAVAVAVAVVVFVVVSHVSVIIMMWMFLAEVVVVVVVGRVSPAISSTTFVRPSHDHPTGQSSSNTTSHRC